MANSREVVRFFHTEVGPYQAFFYKSGMLTISDVDAPPAKNHPGEPQPSIRLTDLGHEKGKFLISLANFLAEVRSLLPQDYPIINIDYTPGLYKTVLHWAVESDDDVLFRFAVLCATTADTRDVPFPKILEIAEEQRHRLPEVFKYNSWDFFLREDLGLLSSSHFTKPWGEEAFDEQREKISEFLNSRISKLALRRLEAGVMTSQLNRRMTGKIPPSRNHLTDSFRKHCGLFLSEEEIIMLSQSSELQKLCKEHFLPDEVIVILGFAYGATESIDRTTEVALMIVQNQSPEPDRQPWFPRRQEIRLSNAVIAGEVLNVHRLQEALLMNGNIPAQFAYIVSSVPENVDQGIAIYAGRRIR